MTATSTTPVILRPAFPIPFEEITPTTPNSSTTSASTSPPSSIGTCLASQIPALPPTYLRAYSPQRTSLPKSKTNRLRKQEQQWQHTPSTTIQVPPWYTTERADIQPLRLRIPHSSYTPQNLVYHQHQGKHKTSGALCLMPNASPYPRAEKSPPA